MQNVEHASSIYPGISSLSFLMSCLTYHHYYISVCLIFHNILGYQKGYMVLLSENLSIEIHLVNPSNLLFFRVVEEDTRKPPCFGYTLLCYLSHSHIIAAISAFTLPFSWSSIQSVVGRLQTIDYLRLSCFHVLIFLAASLSLLPLALTLCSSLVG